MKKKLKVSFDICSYCNHKCTFCSNSDERTVKNQVNAKDFNTVLENLSKSIEIVELGLSAKGEVLINKDLERIVDISKNTYHIPYVYFSTNGSLLRKEKSEKILKAGIDSIKFSINAFSKNDYNKVHMTDDFDIVINNLKELINLKKNFYPNLKIFISAVTEYAKESLFEKINEILKDDIKYLTDVLAYELIYTPKLNDFDNIKIDRSNCAIFPFNTIYINSDCTLGFCCKDFFNQFNFGSLLSNNFTNLYNNEKFKSMRNQFKNNKFEKGSLCYNCLAFEGLKSK